jgi:diguanylate cyclase (GGDEF)-like protein
MVNAAETRTASYKNDLQRLTRAVGLALCICGAALLAIVAYAGWSANHSALARERQLIENALDQSVSQVLDQQKAIAWWDDAVANVQQRPLNREWIDANIGVYFHETYGHDEVIIVDRQNRPIYAVVQGQTADAETVYASHRTVLDAIIAEARGEDVFLRVRDRAFSDSQGNYEALLGASFGRWAGHIMRVDGEPAVVAAISIVPNLDPQLLKGGEPHLLLSIVKIDAAFMSNVGASLLIPDLSFVSAQPQQSGSALSAFSADDGAPLGYVAWTPRKPGQTLLFFILPLVALGGMGAGALTWVMMARLKRTSVDLADREEFSRHQSLHDALSGLPNRHHFVDRLQETLDALVQQRSGSRSVVAYIDVDRFKDVNDTLGHQAGDALIMAVAARLREALVPGDVLARFGGDEFAVLHSSADQKSTDAFAERLMQAFEAYFDLYGQSMRMTASIGLARAPEHGDTPQDLMRNADIALYQAKAQGRNRALFFSADMALEIERRREIEIDLVDAMMTGALTLHYQPLIACGNNRIMGAEALLRWRHPVRGDISPAVFVPIAEEAGLMPALGAFVLDRAFSDAKRWPELEISINLSPVQFRHMDLTALLAELLRTHELDPTRIVLEVTEGVLMESSPRNREMLEDIRALGFKVALDDFGTGYSSMRYLCDFRFDKIKIDRAFVTGVDERKRAMTIVQSVITLGRGLGMDIVAEGVETEAEASVMRLVGVNQLQGFYFSRAVPCDELDRLLGEFNAPAQMARSAALTA